VNDTSIRPTSSPELPFGVTDVVRLLLPGGGGYGEPGKRDRRLIESDLRNGYVTLEGARRDYAWDGPPR
jgi:N-methylhydantoinase B